MFVFTPNEIASYIDREFIVILIIAIAFAFITLFKFGEKWQDTLFFNDKYSIKGYVLMTIISLSLLLLCISSITSSGFNPFIYFRF
jgi:alginate O-acetyltransferase complex protein AlgI